MGIQILLTVFLLLFLGDFFATFVYHVPGHVFGKFHAIVHHSPHRSFVRYAILNRKPIVLIDGFLGIFFYLVFIPWLWQMSPTGVIVGLCIAELHVIWRHQFSPDYRTPDPIQQLCRVLGLSTPERHWQHHQNGKLAYGDIFAFFGPLAQWWLKQLIRMKKFWRKQRMSKI